MRRSNAISSRTFSGDKFTYDPKDETPLSLMTKGHGDMYQFSMGGDDTFLVKGQDNKRIVISRTTILENLRRMRFVGDSELEELNETDRQKFDELAKLYDLTKHNNSSYDILVKLLHEAFQGVVVLREGTVGAFFYGSFVPPPPGWIGNPACTPVAASAYIKPKNAVPPCDVNVLIIDKKGVIRSVNSVPSNDGILSTNVRVTQPMINDIARRANITRLKILRPNGDGSYQHLTPDFVPIQELNLSKIFPEIFNRSIGTTWNYGWLWIILILLIIIIIVVIVFLIMKSSPRPKKTTTEKIILV